MNIEKEIKMKAQELYATVVEEFCIKEFHPLHKAIMEECCENAIGNPQGITDKEILIQAVLQAFLISNSIMIGTLNACLRSADANQVKLNYRGLTFLIPQESRLLIQ